MAVIDQETAERVLTRASEGETITGICKDMGVARRSLWDYRQSNPLFEQRLVRALEEGAHAMVDSTVEIADDTTIDAHRARNRINARQWAVERRYRKTYGQHVDLNITERIDISGALIEARRRVSLPVRDQALIEDAQVIDSIPLIGVRAADSESVEPAPGATVPFVNPFD